MLLLTDEGDLDDVMIALDSIGYCAHLGELAAYLQIHPEASSSMRGILTLWLSKVHVWTSLIPMPP